MPPVAGCSPCSGSLPSRPPSRRSRRRSGRPAACMPQARMPRRARRARPGRPSRPTTRTATPVPATSRRARPSRASRGRRSSTSSPATARSRATSRNRAPSDPVLRSVAARRTSGVPSSIDSFSCSAFIPGVQINCTGATSAAFEVITGQFVVAGKSLCTEPRIDPILTVTDATATATSAGQRRLPPRAHVRSTSPDLRSGASVGLQGRQLRRRYAARQLPAEDRADGTAAEQQEEVAIRSCARFPRRGGKRGAGLIDRRAAAPKHRAGYASAAEAEWRRMSVSCALTSSSVGPGADAPRRRPSPGPRRCGCPPGTARPSP